MKDYKCPFCGHDKPYRYTPYVDRFSGEKIKQPCCDKQDRNMAYREKRFDPTTEPPSLDDISKI